MQTLTHKILFLSFFAFLSACANNPQQGSTDASSQAVQSKSLLCNFGTSTYISAKQKVFRDAATGNIDFNYTQLRLTAVPSAFLSTNGGTLTISKWKVTSSNTNTKTNQTTVSFKPMLDGIGYVGNWQENLTYSFLVSVATSYNMTVVDVISKLTLVAYLNDAIGEYEGINITHSTSGSQLDMLIPPFALTPADYSVDSDGSTRPALLQTLHPFISYQSETAAQLASRASAFCF